MPVHTALGGKSRDAIRIYNTCADYQYVRSTVNQNTANRGLGQHAGRYEDLEAFLHCADEAAEFLLSRHARFLQRLVQGIGDRIGDRIARGEKRHDQSE